MKLNEKFKKEATFSEEQSRKAFDEKNDVLANHMAGGASAFRHAAREVEKLEAENAALTKRVAELEEDKNVMQLKIDALGNDVLQRDTDIERGHRNCMQMHKIHLDMIKAYSAQVATLQSQLAWTPVSDGLPTVTRETRDVLVVRDQSGGAMLLEPRYHEDGEWKWSNPEFPFGIKFSDGCAWEYRRIELPKEGET